MYFVLVVLCGGSGGACPAKFVGAGDGGVPTPGAEDDRCRGAHGVHQSELMPLRAERPEPVPCSFCGGVRSGAHLSGEGCGLVC